MDWTTIAARTINKYFIVHTSLYRVPQKYNIRNLETGGLNRNPREMEGYIEVERSELQGCIFSTPPPLPGGVRMKSKVGEDLEWKPYVLSLFV